MSKLSLKIEPSEYASDINLVRIAIPGLGFAELLKKAEALTSHRHYDGEIECERAIFEPRDQSFWFDITGDELVIHGYWSVEGDDRLDGTLPQPQEPSLDDRLKIAMLIRQLIAE